MAQLPRPAAVDVSAAEEDAAGWAEALDVDDSDLHLNPPFSSSLLRPSTAAAPLPDKPSALPHGQRIPGPASAIQDAMRLRAAGASPILGRADAQAVDADFLLHPWLSALQFLGSDRAWEQPGIRAIKADRELDRARLVVGVVTSCKPNGFGDLSLTLKDPTDTICASVHRKVLSEESVGQDISVGCAIVLSKVAVFRPSHRACYLNITKEKVVKVMRKDCDPPSKQDISSCRTSLGLDRSKNVPCYSASQQSLKTVNREFPANWPQTQGGSLPMFERGEGNDSSNSMMMRLFGCEKMMPSHKEMTVPGVSGDRHRAVHSSMCSHTESLGTGEHPQKIYNIPDKTCSQPSPGERSAIVVDRSCTQSSNNKKLRLPDELVLASSKKPRTYDCYDAIMNTSTDTKSKHGSEDNMDIDMNDRAEPFHGNQSTSKPDEHQQKDFCAAKAYTVRLTKETSATEATTNNLSLLSHTKKVVSVASVAEWTDEQLSELFID
ncbi:hypothetical protein EJB05_51670 [Eragrostis curvula]|uniref:Homologous recombination OB-fold protein OB-fold domain-containing protein n=1 Tax=Eragrostis curvula TaxID=38414 RepID=A0A5J9SV29_9POAL|nr:hypothetical protein EJB05_51670 [Eragrostis curvula]